MLGLFPLKTPFSPNARPGHQKGTLGHSSSDETSTDLGNAGFTDLGSPILGGDRSREMHQQSETARVPRVLDELMET